MPHRDHRRVMVTGATGFLGFRVVVALLEVGAEVSVLIQPEQEERLAALAGKIRIVYGDLWNRGSLKGQARGHDVMAHLVGSTHTDPARGLTYQRINLTSARNAVGLAVSDGVSHFLLLSVAGLPGMFPLEYIRSKRDSESYLIGSGLGAMIVRAPFLFVPSLRSPLLRALSILGIVPPFSFLGGRYTPLPVDVAARGIAAALVHAESYNNRIFFARDLRRLARKHSPGAPKISQAIAASQSEIDPLDEIPFGWQPGMAPQQKKRK